MSSGVVNQLATETNSTWRVGGGGGVIWFDVPPLQPAENHTPAVHAIATQIYIENRMDIAPPDCFLHFALSWRTGSSRLPAAIVNTLQNLTQHNPKRRPWFCGKIEFCRNQTKIMGHRTTLEAERPAKTQKAGKKAAAEANTGKSGAQERERIFDAFRRWGYNEANLDPLGFFGPFPQPDLEGLTGEAAEEARRIYCGTIGAEFMHLPQPERRQWIAER